MTKGLRIAFAGLLLVPILVACGRSSGGPGTATAMDVYAIAPTQADVRALLGDSNWYEGPPTFGVLPLDQGRQSMNVKFTVQVQYLHLGTAEQLAAFYSVFETSSAATTAMTNLQTQFGQSPSSPRVGDQVLYYGLGSPGAAPFLSHTFVRVGQIIVEMDLTRKASQASVNDLGRYATKFTAGLRNLGKAKPRASASPANAKALPPPGLDITLLGTTRLPIEAFVVMSSTGLPDSASSLLRGGGVSTFTYGDYALNADVHMEVRTAFLTFGTPLDALTWAKDFGPGNPDPNGLYSAYLTTLGEYHYLFVQGMFGIYIVCKPAVEGESASRACEDPMQRTADGWSLALQGVG